MITRETETVVLEALRRIVRQAFDRTTKRHLRGSYKGTACDGCCQPCAIEQARIALEKLEANIAAIENDHGPSMANERGELVTAEEI